MKQDGTREGDKLKAAGAGARGGIGWLGYGHWGGYVLW